MQEFNANRFDVLEDTEVVIVFPHETT